LTKQFLADRTNGPDYATELRPSVVVCNVKYCGYTVRHTANVTIDSLFWKSYMRNQLVEKRNDLDLCLEVV